MTIDHDPKSQAFKIAKIFSYIGGTLIFFGITYLIFNNWFVLAAVSRILVTLGIACWSIALGVTLARKDKNHAASGVFFLLGALLLPLGMKVTLDALGWNGSFDLENILASGLCFFVFFILQCRYPREILLIITLVFGSLFFIAGTNYLAHQSGLLTTDDLENYQCLTLGVCYLLAGYCFSGRENILTGPLYFLGDLFILGASFRLAGMFYYDSFNLAWEIMAAVILMVNFVLAMYLRSKSLLCLGTIFLIIYITNITRKFAYLFGSLGWPVILIGTGVLFILIGFVILNLQKKNFK